MTNISSLINLSPQPPLAAGKDLICHLSKKWENEFKRLCQPMRYSPSTIHTLSNAVEEDLPSFILLSKGLLFDEIGLVQTTINYDRNAYIELNRGMSSVLALFYILKGNAYHLLIEGQEEKIKLSRESYSALHDQCNTLFKKDDIWNNELLDTIFYAVLFNDLGKNYKLKAIVHSKEAMKEFDHDLILKNAMDISGLLKDFCQLNTTQRDCLRAIWHEGFNPSSFNTLEYPLIKSANWIMSFATIAQGNTLSYLSIKKIEILADIAGANGNRSIGASNLTEPVVAKFNKSFALLNQLFSIYQQKVDDGVTDKGDIYNAIYRKLQQQLLEQAKALGIAQATELNPQITLVLRLSKMLGIHDQQHTDVIHSALAIIKQKNPENYSLLEKEFSLESKPGKPTLWLECIPKFLWLMSNGNNYDLIDSNTLKSSRARQENGLHSALIIVSNLLKKIRSNTHYEELYGFNENNQIKLFPDTSAAVSDVTIASFNAYDLVCFAQKASEVNPDNIERKRAIDDLKRLWNHGVLIDGQNLTVVSTINETMPSGILGNTASFFQSSSGTNQDKKERQQLIFEAIYQETKKHQQYLTSIDWADRATCFNVQEFIYHETDLKTIDLSRFAHQMSLPEIVRTFDRKEKNTLFVDVDSSDKNQDEEIERSLNIRLYPTIRRIIKEVGVTVFLGSKMELQAFTQDAQEKLIIDIEVPSSVKFYIALKDTSDIKVYISGLVSHENLIQQLITLKLADINLEKILILGDTQHYQLMCKNDLFQFKKQSSQYLQRKNVLIVAGCGLEETVTSTLEQVFLDEIVQRKFSGDLVSLTYVNSRHVSDLGFIVLNLNYGEICQDQVSIILNEFNCIGIFTGSAAGYIPRQEHITFPDIGDRLAIETSKHYSGEVVSRNERHENIHLHVPTVFVETFGWLMEAQKLGATTVDVESFYIFKAVEQYQQENPKLPFVSDIGVFISDYVGQKPLRSYNNVFDKYPSILDKFIQRTLVANISMPYENNRSSIPTFSDEYLNLTPADHTLVDPKFTAEAVVDCIGKTWDKSEFLKRVHTPVTIGAVKNKERFIKKDVPRCLHLPIKLPGSNVRIPKEYQHFMDELQQIFDFEASINSGWDDLYAYLTVDQSYIPRSNSQRVPGPHVDGMPRDRSNPGSQLIDHAYLVTNAIPTMFYTQQFNMEPYDPNKHHFFAIFRALSDESRTMTINPFEIALMNAYSVHTPTQTQEDVSRTFIRLEFSTLKFDRSGNSVNPHFSSDPNFPQYPFNYMPRPIPEHLFVPPAVFINKPITNEDYTHQTLDDFSRIALRAIFLQNPRFKNKHSDYKNLELIAKDIMDLKTHGIVVLDKGLPAAFLLYKTDNSSIQLTTLFTLSTGKGQEMMIYGMNLLQQMSYKWAIQTGQKEEDTPLTITVNENNADMLKYFLRSARLAKVGVKIDRKEFDALTQKIGSTEMHEAAKIASTL